MQQTSDPVRDVYDFKTIEPKWQAYWEENETYRQANPGDDDFDASKPKRYILDMFPYPSGAGLHVGHPLGYCATDIYARFSRMQGFNVLHPMGYDAFGLPAEQYAIETGVHPAATTKKNIANMRRQLKMFGFSYDWQREFATCTPDYYKWTQWIFLRLFDCWFDATCEWVDTKGRKTLGRARAICELRALLDEAQSDINEAGEIVSGSAKTTTRWSALDDKAKDSAIDACRLAYIDEVPVNWCPALGTVLANEEVTNDGRSDRGNHPVFRRPLRQWMLRITAYAERLIDDLKLVDWPEPIKLMQRNWIGRSTGAEVDFPIASGGPGAPMVEDFNAWQTERSNVDSGGGFARVADDSVIRVYTTRPDTLFGATYMVLAPEHDLVARITTPEQRDAVDAYVRSAVHKSDLDRTADTKTKSGVFTGGYVYNPANGERTPVWVADYVLMGYGTGAIMAVPGQDQRDWDFAKAFDLPIIRTVKPPDDFDGNAYVGEGPAINSGMLDGLNIADAKAKMIAHLESTGQGCGAVNYKLRDWVFTRQRYWGEPFPILHRADGTMVPVDEGDLPVELPAVEDYKPTISNDEDHLPEPPLSRATEWKTIERDGETFARDLNTMPQWAGSCWYYLRFLDPTNATRFCSPQAEAYWMPVDTYVGGAEHAVLHLLYARFWHKLLFDLGEVQTAEPFQNLINQGMIQAFAYEDSRGVNVFLDDVVERDGAFYRKGDDEPLQQIVTKMSKARRNVVNPDDIISQFGADAFRCYEMFMGPLEASKPWNTRDVPGVFKLLNRIWRLYVDPESGSLSPAMSSAPADEASLRMLHKTIKKVGQDIHAFKFNTAIGQLFEFVNHMTPLKERSREILEAFVLLISPFTPHVAEELWSRLGHNGSVSKESWPVFDESLAKDDMVEIAIQVMGKVKARIEVPADADEKTLEDLALANASIQAAIAGKTVRKVIAIKGRLVNIVAN
ncbi:MAG: leucine--tRNA ligase [Planctomycetes bacterium]|nr:leucine--tRNA ligase [Planctomycetota bacterium]